MAHSGGRMTEEDEAFEELSRRQGDWGLQGSRKHQIMRYLENDAMREVQRLGQDIEATKRKWVDLTDDEIDRVTDAQWGKNVNKPIYAAHRAYARAVEAASKGKNT